MKLWTKFLIIFLDVFCGLWYFKFVFDAMHIFLMLYYDHDYIEIDHYGIANSPELRSAFRLKKNLPKCINNK